MIGIQLNFHFIPKDLIKLCVTYLNVSPVLIELTLRFFLLNLHCRCGKFFSTKCLLKPLKNKHCLFKNVVETIVSYAN